MIKFYIRTALNGLKKNLKLYVPQIISSAVLFAIMYIMFSLCFDETLNHSRGGRYLGIFMGLGITVISILSLVIIFYANNFLMRQRKREYGLYHVLGLEKKHIINIMLVENIITHTISIISGALLGLLFYRLASLTIFNLYKLELTGNLTIFSFSALFFTMIVFVGIYALTYIFNCISLIKLKTTELLLSSSYGEKEPKIKWIVFILGLAFLGTGYFLALTIEKPMEALAFFFVAVICVIFGTYFLFTAGSIFILKALKKKKSFYYKPEHMISVSGMLYRMKQNAAGLASIAILATGVLIMLATTVTLYRGIDDDIENKFPHDMYFNLREWSDNNRTSRDFTEDEAIAVLKEACGSLGLKVTAFGLKESMEIPFILQDDTLVTAESDDGGISFNYNFVSRSDVKSITFITDKTYYVLTGEQIGLNDNEMAFAKLSNDNWSPEKVKVLGLELVNKHTIKKNPLSSSVAEVGNCFLFVVNSDTFNRIHMELKNKYGNDTILIRGEFFADIEGEEEQKMELFETIRDNLYQKGEAKGVSCNIYNPKMRWEEREEEYLLNGSLLFLGILLSMVCFFATALIIYYKQITEGYDDRNRFQIMEKVGLSKPEIKKTIKSQILMVFFIPLLVAGIHTLAAYSILSKIMALLTTTNIFLLCTGIVFVIFSLIYITIYSITARTYFKIVS